MDGREVNRLKVGVAPQIVSPELEGLRHRIENRDLPPAERARQPVPGDVGIGGAVDKKKFERMRPRTGLRHPAKPGC